jgi:TPR repeat protein
MTAACFIWSHSNRDDAELRHDWEDYRRAALTTGSIPFFQERGRKRAEAWKKAAESGNVQGMVLYARTLQEGAGVAKDPAEVVKWLRKAADKGEPVAMTNLGACYHDGLGLTKDPAEATRWYRRAADAGEPLAMIFLGDCHERGIGVAQKDPIEAVKWYRKAADAGAARGLSCLGNCYFHGRGVTKDHGEAVKRYREAAVLGEPFAMNELGDAYEFGNGVSKDPVEAVKWYRRAADAGNIDSLVLLANRMIEGDDHIDRSAVEAVALLAKAKALDANSNNAKYSILEIETRAGLQLGLDELKATRYAEARTRLTAARTASELLNRERPGRFYFMQDLARVWFEFGNLERAEGNAKAAAECYRKAVAVDGPGMTKASVALAEILETGEGGVPKDAAKATELRTAFNKQKIKRFTVQCKIGDSGTFPVHVYIYEVFNWSHPLETQFRYFKEERGFDLPKDVMDSFERLYKIAKENNMSFTDLCVDAMGDKKGEPKEK